MWPRLGSSTFVTRWIVVTIAASIFAALDGGWLVRWLALEPARVWHGQLWRLATWPLVELGPISLVLTCAAIYKLGGELAIRWGDRRLRRFVLEVIVGAAVVTCALAAATRADHVYRIGGWAVMDVLVIAWARQFPSTPMRLYGLLVVRGRTLVRLTCGVNLLFAIRFGVVTMAPELAACAAAALYPTARLRR